MEGGALSAPGCAPKSKDQKAKEVAGDSGAAKETEPRRRLQSCKAVGGARGSGCVRADAAAAAAAASAQAPAGLTGLQG